ncbi:MAG TPA: hypothetical protein VFE97_01515 [Methylomirabilota bacterium]|nr:hypothetical protein [Methylomirabilota bacterium]
MTTNARRIVSAGLLALTAVATTACGALNSPALTPSASTTTLTQGWEHWFSLEWTVESEGRGENRIRGYITNTRGEAAEPLRLLAQALDPAGAIVGQRIAWVPEGVGGMERAYFQVGHLPVADHYRVSVWDYSFLQADAGAERP